MDRRSLLAAGMVTAVAVSVATPTIAAPASHAMAWNRLMARMEAAKAAYYADPARDDDLCDAWSKLEGDLMAMPAPNRAALRWKLDHLMDDNDGEWMASHSVGYVRQTMADYRRLLADA